MKQIDAGQISDRWLETTVSTPVMAALVLWSCLVAESVSQEPTGTDSSDRILDQAVEAYGQRQYDKAATMLNDGVRQFPDNKDLLYWLGMTCRAQGNWDDASEAFKRVCELDPKDAEAPSLVAETYMRQRKYALAVRWYEKAVLLAPEQEDLKSKLEEAKKAAFVPSDEPVHEPETPPDGEPAGWLMLLRHGLVGQLSPNYRILGNVIAVLGGFVVPGISFNWCIRHYRLPLAPTELATGWICGITCFLYFFVVWGYTAYWFMAVLVLVSIVFGRGCYNRAKAMSIERMRSRARHLEDALRDIIRRSSDDD